MKRTALRILIVAAALSLGAALAWRQYRRAVTPARASTSANNRYVATPPRWSDPRAAVPVRANRALTAAQKAAAVERISRDYDEIRSRSAAEYSAAGAAFPGGLNAFLRQLALLQSERRRDLLKVLSPGELEEIETRETHAGELVKRLLADTSATDEQRRTVFRLQRDFDDQFGLTFDLSPAFLATRERERQALQERVRNVLGDALFPAWLRGEGSDFATFTAFANSHSLAPTVPLELWRLRNLYTLTRLEIAATPGVTPEQVRNGQEALARGLEREARALLGDSANDPGADEVLGWLPKP